VYITCNGGSSYSGHGLCLKCLDTYADSRVKQHRRSKIVDLSCPVESCSSVFPLEKLIVLSKSWKRFDNDLLRRYRTMSRFGRVIECPDTACLGVAELSSAFYKLRCASCSQKWGNPSYSFWSWITFGFKQEKEMAKESYVPANTKPCPRCSILISKNGGCNHMCCSSCGMNFFWDDLSLYPQRLLL